MCIADAFQRECQLLGALGPLSGGNGVKRVDRDRRSALRVRLDHDHVVPALRRNPRENQFGRNAVRVNKRDPVAVLDVIQRKLRDQRRFSGPSPSDQKRVRKTVWNSDLV